ncbi:monofunctional biosynthetic peptidoglycan transglycosylase [Ginsengibacter hankyongi]|uniref:Biosynthetic peptidoglycan transglycosylase n=1 Tax=Ginsengibacter hankyongi TaxID=2607284 RepID=A0A5J5INP9_9BACT|nr:monofunctional biosynthetic peptidoglycan transglycosylase [Ginsengibacter hankyongi]KAA9041953.1 monofunctional biosynthetic peptidoglycan transglycosylase [Ginsengibacter hankyongi]
MAKQTNKRGLAKRIFRIILKTIVYGFLFSVLYILFCKWINPPITLTQIGSLLQGHGLHRTYVKFDEMNSNVKLSVMASEDQLFPDHNGFDFKSIQKAMKHNRKSKSLRGASTISQQVAKNVFLWQHGGYLRKGLEVYFTFMIETFWSKQRILEMYLNVAEMGEGIFGVEAASEHYFNKHAKDLSRKQAALIAACLPNPKGYTIKPLSAHVASRYPWILRQMNNLETDPDIKELIK